MSDKQITRESGVLDLFQAGDILVDCGLIFPLLFPLV